MTTSRPPRHSAYSEKVTTGRTMLRPWQRCQGCNARLTIGEPKASDDSAWWQRLRLSEEQRDLLLLASAEFEELSEEAQTISNAVDFVDWLSPSAVESMRHEVRTA